MIDKAFLSPEEIKKRGRHIRVDKEHTDLPEDERPQEVVEQLPKDKFFKRAGKAKISLESMGRFSLPEVIYFKDYSIDNINDLTLATEDNLLETIVAILNEIKNEDCPVGIEEATLEEFFEIMIGIKQVFNTNKHVHRWLCDCQSGKSQEELQINDVNISLKDIHYKSIVSADVLLREDLKTLLEPMSETDYKQWLIMGFGDQFSGDVLEYPKDKVIESIEVKEPITQYIDGKVYKFRFSRIRDLLTAKSLVEKQFATQIKLINSRKLHGVNAEELKTQKEEELKGINKKKTKEVLIATRALALLEYDGKEIVDDYEKIAIYRKIDRDSLFNYIEFLDRLKFGIQDEREFTCPICGKINKRLLQREFDPLEFIPVESASTNRSTELKTTNIFIGL